MDVMLESNTVAEIEKALGERVRGLRLRKNLTQVEIAGIAGVARTSVVKLEAGAGSSVDTLVRVLKALEVPDILGAIAPAPQVSPMALLRIPAGPRRASRKRTPS